MRPPQAGSTTTSVPAHVGREGITTSESGSSRALAPRSQQPQSGSSRNEALRTLARGAIDRIVTAGYAEGQVLEALTAEVARRRQRTNEGTGVTQRQQRMTEGDTRRHQHEEESDESEDEDDSGDEDDSEDD